MKQFTLNKVSKLGDYDEEWGQVFWCEVNEDLMPVRFQKKMADIKPGSKIFAEEVEEKPGKKGPYLQLKKVKVDEDAAKDSPYAGTPSKTPQGVSEHKLDQILELVKENNLLLKQINPVLDISEPSFDESGAPTDY